MNPLHFFSLQFNKNDKRKHLKQIGSGSWNKIHNFPSGRCSHQSSSSSFALTWAWIGSLLRTQTWSPDSLLLANTGLLHFKQSLMCGFFFSFFSLPWFEVTDTESTCSSSTSITWVIGTYLALMLIKKTK